MWLLSSRRRSAIARPRRSQANLGFEQLEDRSLLAVFTPTTFADGGAGGGSLRAAILAVNAHPDPVIDTIRLAAGVYSLSLGNGPGGQENAGVTGDLDIATNHLLVITGAGSSGPNASIIDAAGLLDRVFQIHGGQVIFKNLVIRGGLAQDDGTAGAQLDDTAAAGGGILNEGELSLRNVLITNNQALGGEGQDARGGGLYSSGGSVAGDRKTKIRSNIAQGGEGDIGASRFGVGGRGGDGGDGLGGGVYVADGRFDAQGLTATGNVARGGQGGTGGRGLGFPRERPGTGGPGGAAGHGQGGGLYVSDSAAVTLTGVNIVSNTAEGGAGGRGGFGRSRGAPGPAGNGQGGGLYLADAAVSLTGSKVASNIAQGGSGFITATTDGGDAAAGHGAHGQGGGAYVAGGTLNVTLSSIKSNVARGANGAVVSTSSGSNVGGGSSGGDGQGAGLYVAGGLVNIDFSIIKGNIATGGNGAKGNSSSSSSIFGAGGRGGNGQGAGVYVAGGTVNIRASVIAANVARGGNGGEGGNGSTGSSTAASGGPGGAGGHGQGAGVYVAGGTLDVRGTLITANIARGSQGGKGRNGANGTTSTSLHNGGDGGAGGRGGNGQGAGIYVAAGNVSLSLTQIFLNSARAGAGGRGGNGGKGGDGGSSTSDGGRGGAGGRGGNGGDAQGAGAFRAGGTLNLGIASLVFGNSVTAGAGGQGGVGAPGGAPVNGGVAGAAGANGAAGLAGVGASPDTSV